MRCELILKGVAVDNYAVFFKFSSAVSEQLSISKVSNYFSNM